MQALEVAEHLLGVMHVETGSLIRNQGHAVRDFAEFSSGRTNISS
jgi:hypothetical protein